MNNFEKETVTICDIFLQGDKISMWLCETKPQESVVKIGQTLKRRLGIDDKVSIIMLSRSGFKLLLFPNIAGSSRV